MVNTINKEQIILKDEDQTVITAQLPCNFPSPQIISNWLLWILFSVSAVPAITKSWVITWFYRDYGTITQAFQITTKMDRSYDKCCDKANGRDRTDSATFIRTKTKTVKWYAITVKEYRRYLDCRWRFCWEVMLLRVASWRSIEVLLVSLVP